MEQEEAIKRILEHRSVAGRNGAAEWPRSTDEGFG